MNWRGLIALGWVFLILILLGGFAWLTQNPDSEVLAAARGWPLVGPLADRFRVTYLAPEQPTVATTGGQEPNTEEVRVYLYPEESLATTFVWVEPGTQLHERPDEQSPVLHAMTTISNLPVLERREEWYRVSRPVEGFERQRGWVWLENYQDPTPEALREPDPVLPMPARAPDSDTLAVASEAMISGSIRVSCGLYFLVTDAEDAEWLRLCPQVTEQVEEVYRRRYGLEPVSPPAETILLFRKDTSYKEFRASQGVPWEFDTAHASASRGYLAMYQGDRSTASLLGTLVHELVHLLNRRALGPWLPPWLEEGIADDLGESQITEEGAILPGVLGGEQISETPRITRQGAVAAAIDLQELHKAGELPTLKELIQLDRDQFYDTQNRSRYYALSSFWIRFLLSDFEEGSREGFRSFLQTVARGEAITGERLLEELGTDWDSLESGFRTWLQVQFLMPPNETQDESD